MEKCNKNEWENCESDIRSEKPLSLRHSNKNKDYFYSLDKKIVKIYESFQKATN